MGHSRPLFLYFRLSTQLTVNKCLIKVCQWLDSNHVRGDRSTNWATTTAQLISDSYHRLNLMPAPALIKLHRTFGRNGCFRNNNKIGKRKRKTEAGRSMLRPAQNQCDQIGRFLQVLGNKLYYKRSPNILVTFWAISNNVTIMLKVCGFFLGNFLFHQLVSLFRIFSTKFELIKDNFK